jgi:hypothetical protein
MYPANAYIIRQATVDDVAALHRLAEVDSQKPLYGPVLVGEVDGTPVAAVSLVDGRIIADPFHSTATLRQLLQMRFRALRTYSTTPWLPERLRGAMAPFHARLTAA